MKANKEFRTLLIEGCYKAMDYPTHIPLPRIGESIMCDLSPEKTIKVRVEDILHIVNSTFDKDIVDKQYVRSTDVEIRIIAKPQ